MAAKQKNYKHRDIQETDIRQIIDEDTNHVLAEGCRQAHNGLELDDDTNEPDELGELNFELEP